MLTIHFSHPQYLLLLPLAWAFTWWVQRSSLADLGRGRGNLALGMRAVLLTLLILGLAGIQLVRPTEKLCTVFVVDVSDSIPQAQRQPVLDYIRSACKQMKKDDSAALVAFGAEALLDHAPDDPTPIRKIISTPGTSRTDIAAGIQLAMASFPPDAGKQIVLFSDGNENLGDLLAQAGQARSSGVRISEVPLVRDTSNGEVLLLHAEAPNEVKQGEPFQVAVVAESLLPTDANIVLFRNNTQVEQRAVHLPSGKTVVSFEQSVPKSGLYHFQALLQAPAGHDTIPDNNVAYAYTRVQGKPKVLIVEGQPGDGQYLARAMQAQDLDVQLGGPACLPHTLVECSQYESLVLANVAAWQMSPAQMAIIHSAVRDTGMGFCMVGGETSFGAGGFYHTPIETALPISLDIKKKKRYPSVAVALVIENLEVQQIVNTSIEAAKSSVDLLEPIDYVGVLGCDWGGFSGNNNSSGNWVIPMQHVKDRQALKHSMDGLTNLGDPPSYDSFLREAARGLGQTNARVKHILLIGDGDAVFEANQQALSQHLAEIRAQGVTISTIATGIDGKEAQDFMAAVAQLGGGQAYVANKPEDLPRLLTRDEQTISKPPIYERPFNVQLDDDTHPITHNVDWSSAPPLLGYVVTSEKEGAPTARVLLSAPHENDNDPVLAAWPFGLGRTVAFTSDATAHWGVHWLGWSQYASFWAQTLRWTLRRGGKGEFETSVNENHGRATIAVEAITKSGDFRNQLNLRAHIAYVSPDTPEDAPPPAEVVLPLEQSGPGHYEADFEAKKIGAYLVTVEEREGDATKAMQMSTLVIPYSPEYQTLTANTDLLMQVAELTGGVEEPKAEDIYGRMRFHSTILRDIWPSLIALLAVLFLLDVGLRRVLLPWHEVFAIIGQAIRGRLPSWQTAAPAAADSPTLEALLNTRSRVRRQPGDALPPPLYTPTPLPEEPEVSAEPEQQPATPQPVQPTHVTGTLLERQRQRKGK